MTNLPQHRRQVAPLRASRVGELGVRCRRRDEDLVGVAREVGNERDGAAFSTEDAPAILSSAAMMSSNSTRPVLVEMALAGAQLGLDVLEHEVRRVDLAVRMRIADADGFALVLEDQHVGDFGAPPSSRICSCHVASSAIHAVDVELGQRHVVPRAVADDARDARGRPIPVDARRRARSRGASGPTHG